MPLTAKAKKQPAKKAKKKKLPAKFQVGALVHAAATTVVNSHQAQILFQQEEGAITQWSSNRT